MVKGTGKEDLILAPLVLHFHLFCDKNKTETLSQILTRLVPTQRTSFAADPCLSLQQRL